MGRRGRVAGAGPAAVLGVLAIALAGAPGGAWAVDLPSECLLMKRRSCRRSMHCLWSGSSCAYAGDSGADKCAAVQVKRRKRKICQSLQLTGGKCVCSIKKRRCGSCAYQGDLISGPSPGPSPGSDQGKCVGCSSGRGPFVLKKQATCSKSPFSPLEGDWNNPKTKEKYLVHITLCDPAGQPNEYCRKGGKPDGHQFNCKLDKDPNVKNGKIFDVYHLGTPWCRTIGQLNTDVLSKSSNFEVCKKTGTSWTKVDDCHVNIKGQPAGCQDTMATIAHHIAFSNKKRQKRWQHGLASLRSRLLEEVDA